MRYSVKVKLNKDFIEVEGDKIAVGIKAVPEKGKANAELIKKLARHFKVPLNSVKIITGRTSRNKVVDISS